MILVAVRVHPGASRDMVTLVDDALDVQLLARAVEGKANRALVRVIAGDLVGDDAAVLEGLEPLRADLADIRRRIELAEERARSLPHRERNLLLAHGLTLRLVAAYEEWLDEVERKFKPG